MSSRTEELLLPVFSNGREPAGIWRAWQDWLHKMQLSFSFQIAATTHLLYMDVVIALLDQVRDWIK